MTVRQTRPVSWIKAARRDFEEFPKGAQREILNALTIAAEGQKADIAKPMKGLGSGVFDVALALARQCLPDGVRSAAWG